MKKWLVGFIVLLFIGFGFYIYFTIKSKNKYIDELTEQIEYYKQAANPSKEVIDSLAYNIHYRDSIIYNIKHKYITDVELVKEMSDSTVVNYFKQLVWTD